MIKPFLDKFYKDENEKKQAFTRHLEFFNTHPYMAGVIAALVIKTEEKISQGDISLIESVSASKQSMASPLAAIGDSFFWGTLRTTSALVSILIIVLFEDIMGNEQLSAFGLLIPFVFFAIYNSFHIFSRYLFMSAAFILGKEMLLALARPNIRFLWAAMKVAGASISVIAILGYLFFAWDSHLFFDNSMMNVLIIIFTLLASLFVSKFNAALKIVLIVLICIIWAYLGN
jgi:PTS system mannose-specific IID component